MSGKLRIKNWEILNTGDFFPPKVVSFFQCYVKQIGKGKYESCYLIYFKHPPMAFTWCAKNSLWRNMLCSPLLQIPCVHVLMALVCCLSILETGQYQTSSTLDHFSSTFLCCACIWCKCYMLKPFFTLSMSWCVNTSNKKFRKHNFSLSLIKIAPVEVCLNFIPLNWLSKFRNYPEMMSSKLWAKWYCIWPQMLNI